MCGCIGIEDVIGVAAAEEGAGVTSTGLSIGDGVGWVVGAGGGDVREGATEGGAGWGAMGIGVRVGIGDGVGVTIGAGIGVGAGTMTEGSGTGGGE